jgi:hypothetical protein
MENNEIIKITDNQRIAELFFKNCDKLIEDLEKELESDNIGAQKRFNIQQRLYKLYEHKEGLYKSYYHVK